MKAILLGDRVLVREDRSEQKTLSGILIPDTVGGGNKQGKVVSVGDGLFTQTGDKIPMTVKEGDTVLYDKAFSNKTVKLDEEDFILMKESDILMIIKESKVKKNGKD